jgi:hypothetical protein
VMDAAMKLSRALGASSGEAGAKVGEPTRKGNGAAAPGRDAVSAEPILASPGPHSIFR